MNDRCDVIRSKMEAAIGGRLDAAETERIERHCASCAGCREYREWLLADDALLAEFAAEHAESEKRVAERAIAAIPATRAPRRRGRLAAIPPILRFAAAAAAIVGAVAIIDFFAGIGSGPVPAYAAVIAKLKEVENVAFRERNWTWGTWETKEKTYTQNGLFRYDTKDSTYIQDGNDWRELKLLHGERRAIYKQRIVENMTARSDPSGGVSRIAGMYKSDRYTFVKRARLKGKRVAIYTCPVGGHGQGTQTVWVDLKTKLPVRVETIASRPASGGNPAFFDLRLEDFLPPNAPLSAAKSWTPVAAGEPTIIEDRFRWNVKLDDDFFSLEPPEGYTLEKHVETIDAKDTGKPNFWLATQIAASLREWLTIAGNEFPESFRDMEDSTNVRRLLIAAFDRDGDAAEEFRSAMHCAAQLVNGRREARFLEGHGAFAYLGAGARPGDSERIVCWLQNPASWDETGKPYYVIYADLRCELSDKRPEMPNR